MNKVELFGCPECGSEHEKHETIKGLCRFCSNPKPLESLGAYELNTLLDFQALTEEYEELKTKLKKGIMTLEEGQRYSELRVRYFGD